MSTNWFSADNSCADGFLPNFDEIKSWVAVPDGKHRARLIEWENGENHNGNKRTRFHFELLEEGVSGQVIKHDAFWTPKAQSRSKKFCEDLAVDPRDVYDATNPILVELITSTQGRYCNVMAARRIDGGPQLPSLPARTSPDVNPENATGTDVPGTL